MCISFIFFNVKVICLNKRTHRSGRISMKCKCVVREQIILDCLLLWQISGELIESGRISLNPSREWSHSMTHTRRCTLSGLGSSHGECNDSLSLSRAFIHLFWVIFPANKANQFNVVDGVCTALRASFAYRLRRCFVRRSSHKCRKCKFIQFNTATKVFFIILFAFHCFSVSRALDTQLPMEYSHSCYQSQHTVDHQTALRRK